MDVNWGLSRFDGERKGWCFSPEKDSGDGEEAGVGCEMGGLWEETAGGQHQDVFSGETAEGWWWW